MTESAGTTLIVDSKFRGLCDDRFGNLVRRLGSVDLGWHWIFHQGRRRRINVRFRRLLTRGVASLCTTAAVRDGGEECNIGDQENVARSFLKSRYDDDRDPDEGDCNEPSLPRPWSYAKAVSPTGEPLRIRHWRRVTRRFRQDAPSLNHTSPRERSRWSSSSRGVSTRTTPRSSNHPNDQEADDDRQVRVHRGNPTYLVILDDVNADGHNDAANAAAGAHGFKVRSGVFGDNVVIAIFLSRRSGWTFAATTSARNESNWNDERPVLLVRRPEGSTH